MTDSPKRTAAKLAWLEHARPAWREERHPNGQRKWADDGTMLDDRGMRSIFDDVDE